MGIKTKTSILNEIESLQNHHSNIPLFQHSNQKWFQNLQSGSRSRRTEAANRRNIGNISRIGRLSPTL
jgi:hypothetical protein